MSFFHFSEWCLSLNSFCHWTAWLNFQSQICDKVFQDIPVVLWDCEFTSWESVLNPSHQYFVTGYQDIMTTERGIACVWMAFDRSRAMLTVPDDLAGIILSYGSDKAAFWLLWVWFCWVTCMRGHLLYNFRTWTSCQIECCEQWSQLDLSCAELFAFLKVNQGSCSLCKLKKVMSSSFQPMPLLLQR